MKHFGIEQMPKLHEMPSLETALGRLKDPKELNDLTLGLASTSSRSGKKYNFAVLLDPEYMNKFNKVMGKVQKYGKNLYKRKFNRIYG